MVKLSLFLTLCFASINAGGQVAGRYTDGRDYAVYFENTRHGLSIRPVLWTATQLLANTGKDNYTVVDRSSRGAEFRRDQNGRVIGVTIHGMDGEGLPLYRSAKPLLPVELLLLGRTRDAAAGYFRRGDQGVTKGIETAQQVLERYPTKTHTVIQFLVTIEPRVGPNARFYSLLGNAYVYAGERKQAANAFRRALSLDPSNEEAISGLFRLGLMPNAPTKDGGWRIPFPVSSVFKPPTPTEIRSVEADWATRDLGVHGVREELKPEISFGTWKADVRIFSYLVHGSRNYGAIVIPQHPAAGCCGVIVDVKGVSPSYFPLDIGNVESIRIMGAGGDRFIYVVPSFRGEVMNVGERKFTSEGDRRDALDGATDDTIAFLNVALATTYGADPKRICVYGHSRGGNVALLVGERDRRIKCVVDVAGPTDWLYLMGTEGWTEQELWQEAVRIHADPFQIGGQNLERFLMRAIDGNASLEQVRHNMIASSPLYFAGHLAAQTQMHYGLEDTSVPVRNGAEFVKRLKKNTRMHGQYSAFFYPGQGHDTDRIDMPISVHRFIERNLASR